MAENNSSAPLKTAQGEDERALFEAVASDHDLWPKAIERDAKGNYLLLTTANGWMWWQHARSMPTTAPQSQAEVQAEPVMFINPKVIDKSTGKIATGTGALTHADSKYGGWTFPVYAAPQAQPADALDWAVQRWNDEVRNRPMVNIHRRSLDDTWRQVITYLGGDACKLVGPSHDDLLAAAQEGGKA